MSKRRSGVRRQKKDGFSIRYQQYIRKSIQENSFKSIQDIKYQNENYESLLKRHITTFESSNQTIIGSMIATLLMDAKQNPGRYIKDRTQSLNTLFSFIQNNKAWDDFWVVMTSIERNVHKSQQVVTSQLITEVLDMFRLNLPYSKMLFGLNQTTKAPIIRQMPFYITRDLLTLFESPQSVGRKKTRLLETIKYQTMEWFHYLSFSFGLYNDENSDLIAQNGMNYADIPNIKMPPQLDNDNLINLIKEKRMYTMNPNGVVVECFNCGDIDRVVMVESRGFLLWKVHFKKNGLLLDYKGNLTQDHRGTEYFGYFDDEFFPRSLFTIHTDFIDFEFSLYSFVLECYADIVCGNTIVNKHFNRDAINIGTVQIQDNANHEMSNEDKMGFRYTPRKVYNHAKSKSKTKRELSRELEKYFVSGHLRKLADNHTASDEAIQHAAEYGIEVPENFTFVRPYSAGDEKVRTYYIKRIV